MNKNILLTSLLACALLSLLSLRVSANGEKFQAVFDGETVKAVTLKMVGSDPYVSLRDVSDIYGARLAWRPVSGKVSLHMHNRQMDIFLKNTRVRVGTKKARLSLPSKIIKNEGFIPFDFLRSPVFADFSETVSSWNPESAILTIEPRVNVVASRFYSRPAGTQIIIELLDDISAGVTEGPSGSLLVAVARGRVKEETIHVGDHSVNDIVLKNEGRQALITIGLASPARMVEHKLLENPRRLALTIAASTGTPVTFDVASDSGAVVLSSPAVAVSSDAVDVSSSADASSSAAAAVPAPVTRSDEAKARRVIILDAGHGGEDPGAIGPNGTKEKEINLAIVHELKRLFEEDGGYQVILSRTDDTFIPLVERTSLANDKKADLFVSVHCNANFDRNVSGFEIYFLNENASDPDAAATAMLENSVVKLEGNPNKKRARLQSLLWSLAVNEFINESSELCSFIGSEATKHTKVVNRGVKQAGFFVLKGAQMPAVLVECAFLSNYAEEAKLKARKFQAGIADSIYEGVKRYDERREKLVRASKTRQERS